jgi:hypothetical protein
MYNKLVQDSLLGPGDEISSTTDVPLFVEKRISHKCGEEWYTGKVISVVPGYVEYYIK